ncbi:unnamed protein product [Amoebophrya sp. A25]|nr:unnamed protein product [Amoebophrya sp. A25]|eukprot:GSA25T00022196001.1
MVLPTIRKRLADAVLRGPSRARGGQMFRYSVVSGGVFLCLSSTIAAAEGPKSTELDRLKERHREERQNVGEKFQPSCLALLYRFLSLSWIFFPCLMWAPWCLLVSPWLNASRSVADSEDHREAETSRRNLQLWWFQRLRVCLERAGPVFIKWGQWSSTRYDLFPFPLCEELHKLTQNAPSHSAEETNAILEKNFGSEIHSLLQLEAAPLASGSIGQVYRAQLRDVGEVVVKVQHPKLDEVMATDFRLLSVLSRATDGVLTRLALSSVRLTRVMRQFETHMSEQLDFEKEGRNLEKFNQNFREWPHVSFPTPRCSTREVLIESFEPGASIYEYIRIKQRGKAKSLSDRTSANTSVSDRGAVATSSTDANTRVMGPCSDVATSSSSGDEHSTSVVRGSTCAAEGGHAEDKSAANFCTSHADQTSRLQCGGSSSSSGPLCSARSSGSSLSRNKNNIWAWLMPGLAPTAVLAEEAPLQVSTENMVQKVNVPTTTTSEFYRSTPLHAVVPLHSSFEEKLVQTTSRSPCDGGQPVSSPSTKQGGVGQEHQNTFSAWLSDCSLPSIRMPLLRSSRAQRQTEPQQASTPTTTSDASDHENSVHTKNVPALDSPSVQKLGSLGLLALLKMIICDNFIHADLHPGNILVRKSELPPLTSKKWPWCWSPYRCWARGKALAYNHLLGIGGYSEVPELVILDAGLSVCIEPKKQDYVSGFFRAIANYDGKELAEAIVALSCEDGESHAQFVEDLHQKSIEWREIRLDPTRYQNCRAGDVIKETLDCCRKNGIELHPTVLVASVSALTLEGWQRELDPSICVMDHIEVILRRQEKFRHFTGGVPFRNLAEITHGCDYAQTVLELDCN